MVVIFATVTKVIDLRQTNFDRSFERTKKLVILQFLEIAKHLKGYMLHLMKVGVCEVEIEKSKAIKLSKTES